MIVLCVFSPFCKKKKIRSTAGPRRKTEFGIESDVCTLGSDPMATIYLNDSSVDKFNTIIQYTCGFYISTRKMRETFNSEIWVFAYIGEDSWSTVFCLF